MMWSRAWLWLLVAWVAVAGACGDATYVKNREGNARYREERYPEALALYREAHLEKPHLEAIDYNAANALYQQGQYERALAELQKAQASSQEALQADAYYNLGNTLYRMGRLAEAAEAYKETLRLRPDDQDAKFNLELVMRLLREARWLAALQAAQEPGPGEGAPEGEAPGALPGPGQGPGLDGEGSRPPGATAPRADVADLLKELGGDLSIEDALRLLDALRQQDQGLGLLTIRQGGLGQSRSKDW